MDNCALAKSGDAYKFSGNQTLSLVVGSCNTSVLGTVGKNAVDMVIDVDVEGGMKAGHYENDRESVSIMIRSSQDVIHDLIGFGVDFAHDENGNLAFTREGAHSDKRILFHEDITGKEITQTLLTAAKIKENIEICEYISIMGP